MLMRTDPLRELDRLAQQLSGPQAQPFPIPMDAYGTDGEFVIHFDVPGVAPDSIDLHVEQNVLTVRTERPAPESREMVVAERPHGVFSRQVLLGDTLDAGRIGAEYDAGVLTVRIPVAEQTKPRKIEIETGEAGQVSARTAGQSSAA